MGDKRPSSLITEENSARRVFSSVVQAGGEVEDGEVEGGEAEGDELANMAAMEPSAVAGCCSCKVLARDIHQQFEVLQKINSYNMEVKSCQQEVPGKMAATEGNGELMFAPAGNLLAIRRSEPRTGGRRGRFEGDDAK